MPALNARHSDKNSIRAEDPLTAVPTVPNARSRFSATRHWSLGLLSLLSLLATWQLAGFLGLLRADIVPTPADLVAEFINIAQAGYADKPLYLHVLASVKRARSDFPLAC